MSAAQAGMRTTAGRMKALRIVPRITRSRESKAAGGWLSEELLIRRRPGRPDASTAGVICRWQKLERDKVTGAGHCTCQREGWVHKTSQSTGKCRTVASGFAQGTQGTIGSHARVARHNTRLEQDADVYRVWKKGKGEVTHHLLLVAIDPAP